MWCQARWAASCDMKLSIQIKKVRNFNLSSTNYIQKQLTMNWCNLTLMECLSCLNITINNALDVEAEKKGIMFTPKRYSVIYLFINSISS